MMTINGKWLSAWLLISIGMPLQAQIHYNLKPTSCLNGRVFVFFNGAIDSSKALPGNYANAVENFEQRVIDAINTARMSIDVAAYELNSLNIVVALCKAKERGVRVRLIVDDKAAPNNNPALWKVARKLLEYRYKVPYMTDAGWPWVKSKDNYFKGYRGQMHNKFMVIDYLTPSKEDDCVLTGSYNYTITGLVSMQNMLVIRDYELADIYTKEFEIMWGSSTEVPDTTRAAFHQYKGDVHNGPLTYSNLKKQLEVYLTPINKSKSRPNFLQVIADLISKEAQHDIKICAFSFSTKIEIDDAILEKQEMRPGFDIKAVFEPSLGKQKWSLYNAMIASPLSKNPWKKPAEAYLADEDKHLHHKYLIIDAENPDTTDIPIVITGSLNFSNNANEINDENFLVIRDRRLANQYLQEFYARFNRAKQNSGLKTEIKEEAGEEDLED